MSLLWLARQGRPDLMAAVTTLAKALSTWKVLDDERLTHLMGYVQNTKDYVMHAFVRFQPQQKFILKSWADSDLQSHSDSARSRSGGYLELSSDAGTYMPLTWYSRSQCSTMTSSTGAEVYSLSYLVREHHEAQASTLEEALGYEVEAPVYEDNKSCILVSLGGYSQALRFLPRTTRISLGFLSEYFSLSGRSLQYEQTSRMRADPMTKHLAGHRLEAARRLLRLGPPSADLADFDETDDPSPLQSTDKDPSRKNPSTSQSSR